MLRNLLHRVLKALLWFAAGSALLVLIFRWVPPPGTALMVERKVESWFDGQPIDLRYAEQGAGGHNVSPDLAWSDVPAGTKLVQKLSAQPTEESLMGKA